MSKKQYPCRLSETGCCKHGGNKAFNYGFMSGTSVIAGIQGKSGL